MVLCSRNVRPAISVNPLAFFVYKPILKDSKFFRFFTIEVDIFVLESPMSIPARTNGSKLKMRYPQRRVVIGLDDDDLRVKVTMLCPSLTAGTQNHRILFRRI